jgi:PAT family beta-lactamase induction signal transducer AmpG
MAEAAAKTSIRDTLAQTWALFQRRETLAMVGLGFASGLPLLLVLSTLSVWLREAGVSRTDIGLLSWVLLAYSINVFWSPLVDKVRLPVLGRLLGQRRSWMIAAQVVIAGSITMMALSDPRASVMYVAISAVVLAFASATLDIAVNAWRIESGDDKAQGPLAAAYQTGYRVSNFLAGAGALYIAELGALSLGGDAGGWAATNGGWRFAYLAMAGLTLVGFAAMFFAPEPQQLSPPRPVRGLKGAARALIDPFKDFFGREGLMAAGLVLAFLFIARIPDLIMGPMANPLYVDVGYSKSEIATASKVVGVWLTLLGALVGGLAVAQYGTARLLAPAVLAIAAPNIVFAWLALNPPEFWRLMAAIGADNIANGFGGTVFIAYLTAYSSRAHAATQYAFLFAWMTLPGRFVGGLSGAIVDGLEQTMGQAGAYASFFTASALAGAPALILAIICARLLRRRNAGEASARETFPAPAPQPG